MAEIVPNFDSSKIYKIIISEDTPNFETLCNALKNSSAKFELDLSNTNVATLEKGAIHDLSKMTALELPSGLTTMKAGAIYSNSNLTSIEIPATVTTIEGNPFVYANYESSTVRCYDSSKLTSISIATGNSSYVVDDGILYSSDKTELVYYPSNKTASTFAIPGTVTTIGEAAFAGNTKLTQVNFNAGLTTIGDYAFAKLSNNKTVIIPASVTSIGKCSFYANYKLETLTITGGNSYTIGNYAFSYFGIKAQGATKNCKVTIGEGVESLSQSAFQMSYFDTSENDPLVLPASLNVLDRFNFDRGEVKFIKSLATTPPEVGNSSLYSTGIQKIFVPSGSVEAYKSADGWKEYTIIGF